MKKSAQKKLNNGIIMTSSIISGILVKSAIKKVRQKMEKRKMKKKNKIYEAPWPNALKWTLATSLASGFAGLLIKRYSSKGLKKIKA